MTRPSKAHAVFACTAAEVVARDPECPTSTAPCTISRDFEIGDQCVLDFGTRTVTLTGTMQIGQGSVTLRAGQFIVSMDGLIQGSGDTGGSFSIRTTGDFRMNAGVRRQGSIAMSGTRSGGNIDIVAGGAMQIDGELAAQASATRGAGGGISLDAGGDLTIGSRATVSVAVTETGGAGGSLEISAKGLVDLGAQLKAGGSAGGTVQIFSQTKAILRDIEVRSLGDAGEGGEIDVSAPEVEVLGFLDARGHGPVEEFGGDGGTVSIEAFYGDLNISGRIDVGGGAPDGAGGAISTEALGTTAVASGGRVEADAGGIFGFGGEVSLLSNLDFVVQGLVSAKGGSDGGELSVEAGRSMQILNLVSAAGSGLESFGGVVEVIASTEGAGTLSVGGTGTIDASGGGCLFGFCGAGGQLAIEGCVVSLASGGLIDARAGEGGTIEMVARDDLNIDGTVSARGTLAGVDGTIVVTVRNDRPPSISKPLDPVPTLMTQGPCVTVGQTGCLVPCPECGNSVVELPETCDDGSPGGCDGCSIVCTIEVCDDGNPCTEDLCESELGCRSLPAPSPCTPTPARTASPTPTRTRQPGSPSPNLSRTPTATATATPTRTLGDPGDANCDGRIDTADLRALVDRIYSPGCSGADANEDGVVSAADLVELVFLLAS